MTTTNTHKTYTDHIAQGAQALTARWEALVAEGEATTQGISWESEDHLTGRTDYSLDMWEGNEDLTEDEAEWSAMYELACQAWLAHHPVDPTWEG